MLSILWWHSGKGSGCSPAWCQGWRYIPVKGHDWHWFPCISLPVMPQLAIAAVPEGVDGPCGEDKRCVATTLHLQLQPEGGEKMGHSRQRSNVKQELVLAWVVRWIQTVLGVQEEVENPNMLCLVTSVRKCCDGACLPPRIWGEI